jgi:signal transduction histidine kinase
VITLNPAMMNEALRNYPRLRQFIIDFAIITVLNVVIALICTYMMNLGRSFYANLVLSMCIGWLSDIFIDGTRLLIWGLKKPPRLPFIGVWFVGIPTAQYLGNRIGGYILGIPVEAIYAVRERNSTGLFLFTILVCVFISYMFWNRMRMEHLKAEAEAEKARSAAIEKQALQAQLRLLQAQIEPHMLFNTLANLKGLIGIDAERAQHMLDQLIQYMRVTLLSSRAEHTTLGDEFALMDAYLGLMSVRMGSRLSYGLALPDDLRAQPIPPMLLQPLVENAIKHGLEPKIEGGRIEVQVRREHDNAGDLLILTVADTGLGLDCESADSNGTHVGLANICERLRALYGARAGCVLTPNTPSGAIATLTIPL